MNRNKKRIMKKTVASKHLMAISLIVLGLPCLLSAQTLVHRYSFVTNANDSVGTANGTNVPPTTGGAATISNGLNLPGNATAGNGVSGYVSLPNGLIHGDTNITVECWLTQNQANTWGEAWDFGSSGTTNFALIPAPASGRNGGNMIVAFTPNGNEIDLNTPTTFPSGTEQYVAVTYNNSSLMANLYLNGALDGTATFSGTNYSPGTYGGVTGTTANTFGNDVYGDPQFGGTIYEVRIWNGVVPERYISASALLGPSTVLTNLTPTSPSMTVTTNMVITGTQQAAVYVQLAATGTTNLLATADATNWSSANTNVLMVNSSGLITGVGIGATTVKATVAGVTTTSSNITVAPQTLLNRYSFVSDATDSVSGANGTLIAPTTGSAATISHGLTLPGSTIAGSGVSGYVSLPSGLLTNTTSVTVECWVTESQPNTWAELWDFGNNGNQNFGLIPNSGSGNMRVAFTPNGGEIDIASAPVPTNSEQYIAVTYNNATLTGSLYTNGLLDATQTYPNTTYAPGSIGGATGTTENMLGNDVYGDEQFSGTVYEFRIWNGALSPLYVALSAAAGPNVVVTNLKPTTITLTVTNTSMVAAQIQQAAIVGTFSTGTNVTVTDAATNWVSSNPNVLTVNSTGLITAVAGGNATVSAVVNGVTATSAPITVALTAPKITQQPSSINGVIGETVTFTVVAEGGNLSYQWNLGVAPIQGATNATFTLTNLTFSQASNYSVTVSNTLGSTNSIAAILTVNTSVLAHRYSFTNDASDSVGGPAWNGIIVPPTTGAPATINNGLNLPGNPGGGNGVSGYVALPNGIVAGDSNVTVECWVTPSAVNTWAEIWDFGSSGSINFALIQDSPGATGQMRVAFTPNGNERDIDAPSGDLPAGSESYVVVTYNNANLTANLYLNGAIDGTTILPNGTYSPGAFGGAAGTTQNTFGNDVFGDPQFGGTIYEVRIWNGVVSQRYISAQNVLGPGVIVTNLTPTSVTVTAPSSVTQTGTGQAAVDVTLAATGSSSLLATADATNWVSANTNVVTVNSSGVITGVGPGTTTVSATVAGVTASSDSITVSGFSLLNRYSFISDASDSVGGANGTLIPPTTGAAATISNGLYLPGSATAGNGISGYVSLPPGMLVGTSSLTVECWLTESQANTWAEAWDFGNNGSQNFALIPHPGNNNNDMSVAFTPNGGEIDVSTASLFPTNVEQYVCLTYNNSSLMANLYTNGVLDATQTFPNSSYAPGNIGGASGTIQDMLGNDVYGDEQFSGVIYEFRIWNGVVSSLYISVSAASGSSVVVTNLKPTSLAVTVTNNLTAGQTQQATVVGNFTTASNVTVTSSVTNWTSSSTNVLSVSSSGLITAIGGGSATVSATVGGVTATSGSISVAVPVSVGIAASGGNIVLTWAQGTLLQATNLLGPWTTNVAGSPYMVPATNSAEFYKIRVH
jgi:hypothetical protein